MKTKRILANYDRSVYRGSFASKGQATKIAGRYIDGTVRKVGSGYAVYGSRAPKIEDLAEKFNSTKKAA
jgi:hypothetical protein